MRQGTMDNPSDEAIVRGERVRVLGPKPDEWEGLGQTYKDAVLVVYPDDEIGAVPSSHLRPVE